MTTVHPAFKFFGGDDWEIEATLIDEKGNPYNLTPPTQVKWLLVDGSGARALDQGQYVLSIIDALAGKCAIKVLATVSTTLAGQYSDFIRIIAGGVTSTLATGPVQVTADPWATQAARATYGGRTVQERLGMNVEKQRLVAVG